MTQNQINYAKHKEDIRANKAKESIEIEANRQKRIANELQAQKQSEEIRHNMVSENISKVQAQGTALRGQAAYMTAQESKRHNLADEAYYGLKYGNDVTKYLNYFGGGGNWQDVLSNTREGAYNIYSRVDQTAGDMANWITQGTQPGGRNVIPKAEAN